MPSTEEIMAIGMSQNLSQSAGMEGVCGRPGKNLRPTILTIIIIGPLGG
jgi:hypothetical protein